jgi:UDP-N-acetylglucosamine--N-acetylmuramyl-(pentapeptide) pyrophosphoryl-undecaprenol N-acetylglucosamine transferase
VGQALVDLGAERRQVLFAGGDRVESIVYPREGFPFLGLELRGLERSLTPRNLSLPRIVWKARDSIIEEIRTRHVEVALGMGGYVTIPTALAARSTGTRLFVAEQNAGAGLANRVASRWAERCFIAFPRTKGMEAGEWVGNPVRKELARFDRERLRPVGLARYDLDPAAPVLGVFGGSLGAAVLNQAAREVVASWRGPRLQLVHLTGRGNLTPVDGETGEVVWRQIEYEDRMELFYAACDLVVARAGGGVAELTATGTPSVLVPGDFGSSGHQSANAEFLRASQAAVVLAQDRIGELTSLIEELIADEGKLGAMRTAALRIARPDAAPTIATAMLEAAR